MQISGAAKEIYDNAEMYQGFEVWRKISQKINVWGERRRDELAEIVNNPKFTGKVEDMAKVLEAWDTSHRYYVAVGGRALLEDDRLRILKKIVPQRLLNDMITRISATGLQPKSGSLKCRGAWLCTGGPASFFTWVRRKALGSTRP